jgi:hypothetical protein
MKYALDRPTLLSLWLVQEGTNFTQIEVVALKEVGFLLSEKPRYPLINPVGDNMFTPVNQPPSCAPWNLFGDGICTPIYKPLDPNVWPKSRNGKKIHHPNTFKLSILQENKWEVGRTFEATRLTPSNIPPPGYGQIYRLLLGSLDNRKQYEVTINDYSACNCMDFSSMMDSSLSKWGPWVKLDKKHLYYILQYAMDYGIREPPFIHYPSSSWNEVHRLLDRAKVLELN